MRPQPGDSGKALIKYAPGAQNATLVAIFLGRASKFYSHISTVLNWLIRKFAERATALPAGQPDTNYEVYQHISEAVQMLQVTGLA
jgi:hypothetical protein